MDYENEDYFEPEDCPELDEAVYFAHNGMIARLEVPDDTVGETNAENN